MARVALGLGRGVTGGNSQGIWAFKQAPHYTARLPRDHFIYSAETRDLVSGLYCEF